MRDTCYIYTYHIEVHVDDLVGHHARLTFVPSLRRMCHLGHRKRDPGVHGHDLEEGKHGAGDSRELLVDFGVGRLVVT